MKTKTVFSEMNWRFISNRRLSTRGYLKGTYNGRSFLIIEHAVNDRELCGYDVYGYVEGGREAGKKEYFSTFEALIDGFDFFLYSCIDILKAVNS